MSKELEVHCKPQQDQPACNIPSKNTTTLQGGATKELCSCTRKLSALRSPCTVTGLWSPAPLCNVMVAAYAPTKHSGTHVQCQQIFTSFLQQSTVQSASYSSLLSNLQPPKL